MAPPVGTPEPLPHSLSRGFLLTLCSLLLSLTILYCLAERCPAPLAPPEQDEGHRARHRLLRQLGVQQGDSLLTPLEEGSRKLPQALIIGVKKGGTRALLEFLRVHPDIRAVGAEPHFFDRNYEKGFSWYSWLTRVRLAYTKNVARFPLGGVSEKQGEASPTKHVLTLRIPWFTAHTTPHVDTLHAQKYSDPHIHFITSFG